MDELVRAVAHPGAGAIVTFAGTTRNETDGRKVDCLTYEAYGEMAAEKLREIADTARGRYPEVRIAIVHRIGLLSVSEVSVGIAVSSPHRPDAFEACRYAIEAIKHDVPIWKKETYADGSGEWIHPGASC